MSDSAHPIDNVFEDRRKKLAAIRQMGVNPYPSRSHRTATATEADAQFSPGAAATLAGRIRSIRLHGKSCFVDIQDGSGAFQLFLSVDQTGAEAFSFFTTSIDVGDVIQAEGVYFLTKKEEKTLEVHAWTLLSKSLRPLPEKWHGLKNTDERYRRRYVDLIMNDEVRAIFETRSLVIKKIRAYLESYGFMEVETPMLQTIPGGASARPFITHINAYDLDLYLRIAPELYLKRLIVGGFERVYELGRSFRNEGVDFSHNPEYTSCEFYWAYQDYEGLMTFTEEMISSIVKEIKGSYKIQAGEHEIDFTPPWPRVSIGDAIKEKTGIDIFALKDEARLAAAIKAAGYEVDPRAGYLKLVDDLYKDAVRKFIIQPTIFINHPVEMEPLAKRSERDPRVVERFQPVVMGQELLKAYSELNDPQEQLERFREQQAQRERGDDEAQFVDMDFVEALEYAMPPTAGWGIGIDRFVALLTNSHTLREVILFPLMKPKAAPGAALVISQEAIADAGMSVAAAHERVAARLKNKNLANHSVSVGAVMRALAERLGAGASADAWQVAGVLHDLDYEDTAQTPERHGLQSAEELAALGIHPHVVHAIVAHNKDRNKSSFERLIDQALYAADPVTGFIVAAALVKPDKKLAGVEVDSLLKKFKDKGFAKGASREMMSTCEAFGLSLREFLEISLRAMQQIASQIGL